LCKKGERRGHMFGIVSEWVNETEEKKDRRDCEKELLS
jgi:hypothetical protein